MKLQNFTPKSPDPYILKDTDQALAKFGHINAIVKYINEELGGEIVTGITAHAGGGQTSATQLEYGVSVITKVITAGDSVKLKSAVAGAKSIIINKGSESLNVFPALGDTINGQAVNTAVAVAPGNEVIMIAQDTTDWETSAQTIAAGNGTALLPSYTFESDIDTGFFRVSANTVGLALGGTLIAQFNPTQLDWLVGNISTAANVYGTNMVASALQLTVPDSSVAVNVTGAITAAQLATGRVTSTSAAAVAATLPTATLLATNLSAVAGTMFEFSVDNSAGSNIVTITMNTGITAITAVLTGGATMTVAAGVVGIFRIIFTSTTVAKIARLV